MHSPCLATFNSSQHFIHLLCIIDRTGNSECKWGENIKTNSKLMLIVRVRQRHCYCWLSTSNTGLEPLNTFYRVNKYGVLPRTFQACIKCFVCRLFVSSLWLHNCATWFAIIDIHKYGTLSLWSLHLMLKWGGNRANMYSERWYKRHWMRSFGWNWWRQRCADKV